MHGANWKETRNWLEKVSAADIQHGEMFGVSTAVTMKIAVFRDIKTQFISHRRHVTSPLQISAI
jgi:hypothetical protein